MSVRGNPGTISYRDLFGTPDFEYVGLDVEAGHNVDIVPDDPFCWTDIAAESFDIVISGQAFEHNPYFWITAAEIARVLVPNGLTAVIAPSAGSVHRFPYDCWRFYPDSWAATSAYVGLDLVESFTEQPAADRPIGGTRHWLDAMMIARKPEACGADFYGRLEAIVAMRPRTPLAEPKAGPAAQAYKDAHTLAHPSRHGCSRISFVMRRVGSTRSADGPLPTSATRPRGEAMLRSHGHRAARVTFPSSWDSRLHVSWTPTTWPRRSELRRTTPRGPGRPRRSPDQTGDGSGGVCRLAKAELRAVNGERRRVGA